ncbi:Ubiquinone biosynthesis monooxygenase UbiB [Moraxella catarrhalis]|uniref:AarF/UbiB family protein n=1 Tax=Moraxella catarrhalis TaxID=480 RepID=UPI0007E360F5|nr:AarF/UbiB family protein [Moraxella catarrhalis]OAV12634.1 Ubiquinone biosynthesis monooxygenase UbiB [Moraxella catarrhalis]OAV23953.1 Ubiquinone biosynthesis monooxygenase UbiB [Moraxella catarrhalis]OAV34589.1 Ubiquinone biosynthesis monooxygenase UbiB [Moraxella catarrhalis]OAV37745.1 Ubiquinone biosynthesis monooxygenase UbiB [Moraxella catarrhalis]RKM36002.1 2-octaprenylphenol hydroxylase [Moraxella catarrhalis]
MLITHRKRLLSLYRIAAKYRLDTHFADVPEFAPIARLLRAHPASFGRSHQPLGVKLALEEMGTLFLKLGQLLSTRSDLLPPQIIAQLSLLQDKVAPFDAKIAIATIEHAKYGLGQPIGDIFARFDEMPLAAASVAQVHTAALHDGREVVVKVVRPNIKQGIISDFELLRQMAAWASARLEAARAIHLIDVVEDYRQIMLNELDLTLEAANSTKMRHNFTGSRLIYVPEVYMSAKQVMVSERIFGVPISQTDLFDALGYDRAALAKKGLTIFFTQVFRDNFFHADMHPGNIFVETMPDGRAVAEPRYIGLDCAIMGELSKEDQLIVARMLLSVMNANYTALVDIIWQAGWIPPSADKYALMRDMSRTVSPMVLKPIHEIDFAGVLFEILSIARRHRMSIPPQLMLLLKTLVHVEGLGRELYPELDIWSLAKPILTAWVKSQLDPIKNMQELQARLPEVLLSTTDLPKLLNQSLQSLATLGAHQDAILHELQSLRADGLNERRHDWIALAGFVLMLGMAWWSALAIHLYLAPIFFILAIGVILWRVLL